MRALGTLFVAGIAGIAALKIVGFLLVPLLGMIFGFLGLVVKAVLLVTLGWFVLRMVREGRRARAC